MQVRYDKGGSRSVCCVSKKKNSKRLCSSFMGQNPTLAVDKQISFERSLGVECPLGRAFGRWKTAAVTSWAHTAKPSDDDASVIFSSDVLQIYRADSDYGQQKSAQLWNRQLWIKGWAVTSSNRCSGVKPFKDLRLRLEAD